MGGAAVDDEPSDVKAPDGGWGWAVLAGGFVITGFSYAFPKAVSVFFKELIREFGVGYSDCAWISSLLLAMLYGTGPLCSVLVNKFGCRPVMMVGGLFASLGMILASQATNIIHIYLCTGVITETCIPVACWRSFCRALAVLLLFLLAQRSRYRSCCWVDALLRPCPGLLV